MPEASQHALPPAGGQPASHIADRAMRVVAAAYLAVLLVAAVAYQGLWFDGGVDDVAFMAHGVVVVIYITSRVLLSLRYRPPRDAGIEPHVAIVMPAFNEEGVIAHSLRSLLALDYPIDKLELIAVNDGSTDDTLARMVEVVAEEPRVRVVDLGVNCGKRAALAVGMRATDAEILAFVDSGSSVEPDALRRLVQGFADERVGAICGHADVANVNESWLTRMQVVRCFVAFRVMKAAESIFGCVTCCSSGFAAYRRAAIVPHLDEWEHQTFFGAPATFGDDHALTNRVLRDWRVLYASDAVSHTAAPATVQVFLRQQLRWKRSWTRESLILMSFVWRKHPLAGLQTYADVLLSLVAPLVAIRALVWLPIVGHTGVPLGYVASIYAMALAYGLYYIVRQPRYDPVWIYGVVFCLLYLAFLLWQTYWAILTARSSSWGTRPSTATGAAQPTANELGA